MVVHILFTEHSAPMTQMTHEGQLACVAGLGQFGLGQYIRSLHDTAGRLCWLQLINVQAGLVQ
jgi:hypothetical protein